MKIRRSLRIRWSARGSRGRAVVALVAALAVTVGIASLALANLAGSTFESGDGNLLVNVSGDKDWANVGIVCPSGPGSGTGCGVDQPTGTGDNSFGGGTKEDDPSVTVVTGSIPPNKNDLTRFYEFSETAGGHLFLYLAWERLINTGAANLDFEINQNLTVGFTAGFTGGITLNRTVGDVLITYDFGGSGVPILGALTWQTAAPHICFSTNKTPTAPGCWADRVELSAISSAEGRVNTATVCDPIAPVSGTACTSDGGGGANQLTVGLFGEAGIDLTTAGIIPPNQCENFGSVFVKSRSSPSFTAELKDFIAPVPISIQSCTTTMTTAPSVGSNAIVNPGTAVTDSATVTVLLANGSNAQGPLGTVTFYVCGPTSTATACTTVSGTNLGTATLPGNSPSTVTSPNSTAPTAGGVYCFLAVYTPANGFTAAQDSDVNTECFTVKATTSITTVLSATSVSIGASVTDQATLHDATSNAGGTVTYNAYGPSPISPPACSGTPAFTNQKTVTNGSVPASNAFTLTAAGFYSWQAVYSGDSFNVGSTSDCTTEQLVVIKNSPTIATTLSATSPINIGTAVHDSATLTGATSNAGGTVTYTVYTDSACTLNPQSAGTVNVTNGVVPDSNPITFNSAGTFFWQAVYSGDANNNGATSVCTTEQLVVKTNPSIATTLSETPISIGTAVHDSATLSGATADASGTVTYAVYTDNNCTAKLADAGTKTVTDGVVPDSDPITFNSAGTFFWQAVYSGDANNNGATSVCSSELLVVKPNQPGMGTAQNLLPNDSATLTGLTGNAGGTVTFSLFSPSDSMCSGMPALTQIVPVNGNGTYSTTNTTFFVTDVGEWRWVVAYSGDANNTGITLACGVENFTITNI
jgi:hypothetical protein